ncbi:KH domain-containing protein, partial [Trifolium medium]|nr:KH domain-containing protein [Trifolium medium]
PVVPYIPAPVDGLDGLSYYAIDSKRHGRGHSYSSGYVGSHDLGADNTYGSYGGSKLTGSSAYGAYESYSLGWDSTIWLPSQNNVSRRRNRAY